LNALHECFLATFPKLASGLARNNESRCALNAWRQIMLKHSFLIIFRNFQRSKISFLINLIGLSTGLVCTILIYLWVYDELGVDKFDNKDGAIYQVLRNETINDGIQTETFTPGLLADEVQTTIPEVLRSTAVVEPSAAYNGVLSAGSKHLTVRPQFVGKDYFKVFPSNFLEGNMHVALVDKNSIVISEDLALKLFHRTKSVAGKVVKFENHYFEGSYLVSGVFRPQPNASSQCDVLLNYNLFLERRPELKDWLNGGPSTFIILKEGSDVVDVNLKITNLLQRKRPGTKETLFLQLYSQRYLYGQYENGVPVGGRIVYVHLFSFIAILILGIACINFMNLSTAKSSLRMKEVGVKKVMGAARSSLIMQYLGESLLLAFLSLMFALLVTELLLPEFSQTTGKSLSLHLDLNLILTLVMITVFTGLFAGSYPALYFSGFNPALALNGKLNNTIAELMTRKGLVVFQFAISVILIVCVLVIYRQTKFIQTKDLGYDKNNVISFIKQGNLEQNYHSFLARIRKVPGIVNASYMFGDLAGGASSRSGGFFWDGQVQEAQGTQFNYLDVDYDLIETLGLHMASGRAFSREFGADSSTIIFNEEAIKAMGLKDPIGKTVEFYGERQIIGVVKDFYFESLTKKVKPFFFKIDYEKGGHILVRMKSGTERNTIDAIQAIYRHFNPGFPFEFTFLNEDYQAQYVSENRTSTLSRYFAGTAIILSCLGLFGLATFTAERRQKEIAIRKTLGCSRFGVIYLLSMTFIKIILLAICVALPISYILSRYWLDTFAYRTTLDWWVFGIAGLLSLLMASMAIGMQILHVAKVNPAQSLKQQ
jgi:ABC-type antimicrobial peptide transport system permease subunit